MKGVYALLFFLLMILKVAAQDACPASASPQCFPVNGTTAGAGADCGGADGNCSSSGGTFCYSVENSLWYTFTTNQSGGTASIRFTSISCATGSGIEASIISFSSPCTPPYTVLDCDSSKRPSLTLSSTSLVPGTTYAVHVDGIMTASGASECSFTLDIAGTAVDPAVTYETVPVNCGEKRGAINITSTDYGPGPYTYSFNGGQPQATGTYYNASAGANAVAISNGAGCTDTVLIDVPASNNYLTVDAGPDITVIEGEEVTLSAESNSTIYRWYWNGEVVDTTNSYSVVAVGNPRSCMFPSPYIVTVETAEGCRASDTVVINVLPLVNRRGVNTFTPNGDGTNDSWLLSNIECYPEAEVFIYDRWGQRVFHSKSYSEEPWEGKFLGAYLPVAAYYYVIELNAKTASPDREVLKGAVNIVR